MTANHNWLCPSRNWLGNTIQYDGLTEHSSAKDVTDLHHLLRSWRRLLLRYNTHRAVRALPHLFELELLHTSLVGRDCRTLDADLVLEDGIGGFHSHLVVGLSPHECAN
jgi:hypothetical protein